MKNWKQSSCSLSSKDLKESRAFHSYSHQLEPLEQTQTPRRILYPIWPGIPYQKLEVVSGSRLLI